MQVKRIKLPPSPSEPVKDAKPRSSLKPASKQEKQEFSLGVPKVSIDTNSENDKMEENKMDKEDMITPVAKTVMENDVEIDKKEEKVIVVDVPIIPTPVNINLDSLPIPMSARLPNEENKQRESAKSVTLVTPEESRQSIVISSPNETKRTSTSLNPLGITPRLSMLSATNRQRKKTGSFFSFLEKEEPAEVPFAASVFTPDIQGWADHFTSPLFTKDNDKGFIDEKTRTLLFAPEQSYSSLEEKLNKSIVLDEIIQNIAPLQATTNRKSQETVEIESIKDTVAAVKLAPFVDQFQDTIQDDVMLLGSLSLEDVEMEERKMEESRLEALREEVEKLQLRALETASRESEARNRILELQKNAQEDLARRRTVIFEQHQQNLREQQTAFREAELQLIQVMSEREAEVKQYFGSISESDKYGAVKGRRYQVDWSLCPRSVRIRFDALRALKNKVPKGRYVMMATLYDRIGGQPLRWSNLDSIKWTGSTPFPVRFEARFHDQNLEFRSKNNRIFIALPSEVQTRPSMCFYFELFLLKGKHSKVDRVVGWSVFPICDANFNLIQGGYKVPLLRGEVDASITKYEQIEAIMTESLDSWLCNAYFNVQPLPRYMNNQKEYTVELNFTSSLLQLRNRSDENGEESEDEDVEVKNTKSSLHHRKRSSVGNSGKRRGSIMSIDDDFDERKVKQFDDDNFYESDDDEVAKTNERRPLLPRNERSNSIVSFQLPVKDLPPPVLSNSLSVAPDLNKVMSNSQLNTPALLNPTSPATSILLPSLSKVQSRTASRLANVVSLTQSISNIRGNAKSQLNETDAIIPEMKENMLVLQPASAEVKLEVSALSQALNKKSKKSKKMDDKSAEAIAAAKFRDELDIEAKSEVKTVFVEHKSSVFAEAETTEENLMSGAYQTAMLDKYKFSVLSEHDNATHGAAEKISYIKNELIDDLGITKWRSAEFWLMMFLLALTFYFRVYAHFVAQYLWLSSIRVPIVTFSPTYVSMILDYPTANVSAATQIGVIMIGPLLNIGMFVGIMLMGYLWQKFLHNFPVNASRLCAAYGINVILDPLLFLLVDLATQNYSGDAFKLYNYFNDEEGSGVPGVILTVFFDAILMFVSSFLFYHYLLYIHMNGRMLDVYHRLHGQNSSFFIPDDMEISLRNLRWILTQAKRWTGYQGSVRKIAVTSYIVKDHEDPDYEECSIHIAVFTQDINGQRQLYRQFLRRHDGAIIELFDTNFDSSLAGSSGTYDLRALELMLTQAHRAIESSSSSSNVL